MRNIFAKMATLLIVGTMLFVDGCKENEITSPSVDLPFAFLINLEQQRLTEYDPEILSLIHQDLTDKKKAEQAQRLRKTYNFETGKLYPEALEYAKTNPSSNQARTNSLTWSMNWWSQNTSSSDIGGIAYPDATGTTTIGASSHWLVGFRINTSINYPSTPWAASNTFSYNACDTNGLWEYQAVNNWRITSGDNTVKFNAYWIWVGSEIACYAYYRSLLTDNTTTGWISNGATLGHYTSTKGIKTIQLKIVSLEGGCGT